MPKASMTNYEEQSLLVQYYWLILMAWQPHRVILCLEVKELHSLYVYIYIFFCIVVSWNVYFFAHDPIEYECFLNRSFWSIDRILTHTTTLSQSGPGSNGNKGVPHTPQISKNEVSISGHFFWGVEVLPFCREI